MDTNITISDLRKTIGKAVAQVQHTGDRILVFRHGRPTAALVPYDDLKKLEAAERGRPPDGPYKAGSARVAEMLARMDAKGEA